MVAALDLLRTHYENLAVAYPLRQLFSGQFRVYGDLCAEGF